MKINKADDNRFELVLTRAETEMVCFCFHAARFYPYEAFEMYNDTPEHGERLLAMFRNAIGEATQDRVSIALSKRDLGRVVHVVETMNVTGPEDSHPELRDIAPDEIALDEFSEALYDAWS